MWVTKEGSLLRWIRKGSPGHAGPGHREGRLRSGQGHIPGHGPGGERVHSRGEICFGWKEARSIRWWTTGLLKDYPFVSLEDPFEEEAFDSFAQLTKDVGSKLQIVGDDLFVTNVKCSGKRSQAERGTPSCSKSTRWEL